MKKILTLIFAIIFIVGATSCTFDKEPIPIKPSLPKDEIEETNVVMFNNNFTDYKVVLPTETIPSENKAVDELTLFFKQATNISLQLINDSGLVFNLQDKYISLGKTTLLTQAGIKTESSVLGPDGFIIKTVGNTVFLSGYNGNGTIFSVYKFLEKMFDYKYYAKNEIKIQQKTTGNLLNFNIIERPSFDGRHIDAFDLNSNYEYQTRMRITPGHPTEPYFTEGWSNLNDQSLATQILKYDVYKDREGWFTGDLFSGQLNITKAYYDEEMFNEFTNNLINDYISIETSNRYFMLGINDHTKGWKSEPHREDYDKYKASGVMVRFVNKVGERVQEWIDENQPGRQVYLVMFAYLYTMEPPVNYDTQTKTYKPIDESVVCNDNVMVRIAPLRSQNMYSHLDNKVNPESAYAFEGWGSVAKNLSVWDYGTNFNSYLAPYPDWSTLQENLEMYVDKGVKDLFTQLPNHTKATSLHDYKIFMRSELMWNVNENYNKLHNDFFENYYKQAAPVMQEYFNYIVMHYLDKTDMHKGNIYYQLYTSSFWSYGNIIQLKKYINEAKKAIEPLKYTNEQNYNKVLARLEEESLFYRFMEIDAFDDYYSIENLSEMINLFEKHSNKYGLVAISNQTYITPTRGDTGLITNVISAWRRELLG